MKRKLIYGLLAVLISFGLWLYVVTVVNPEWEDTFYNIPVVLENEEILLERGLMLVSDEKPTVTLRLSGNRADMIKLNAYNITIRADLSRIYSAGEQSLSYTIVYPGDVPNNAFEILSQTPQQITLSVAEWKSKNVDVQVVFDGAVPEQYIAFKDEATLDYEKITVTGPSDVIDRIAAAKVQVSLNNQTETISQQYTYTLCDSEGSTVESEWVKTNVQQVLYTLKIQQWKNISLVVDIVDGGGLKKENCDIQQTLHEIQVSGSEKVLANLPDTLVLDEIRLGELTGNPTNTYTYTYVIELPEGITKLTENNSVDVTVKIPGLPTKEITVTDIQAINAPAGTVIDTTEVVVTVRGPKEYLDLLTPADLQIQVDLSGAAGTARYKATVIVTNAELAGFVGAVGSNYKVMATVPAANG